jgi:hypothetical protein
MSTTSKWTVVVGNGKRTSRYLRKAGYMKRIQLYYLMEMDGVSINEKGEIVDDEVIGKSSNASSCGYDLSFQPDMEAGCY